MINRISRDTWQPLKDCDISQLWAEHYPKSKTSVVSKAYCMLIAGIFDDKAQAITTDNYLIDKLLRLLDHFSIPEDQFYEIEKESREDIDTKKPWQ